MACTEVSLVGLDAAPILSVCLCISYVAYMYVCWSALLEHSSKSAVLGYVTYASEDLRSANSITNIVCQTFEGIIVSMQAFP